MNRSLWSIRSSSVCGVLVVAVVTQLIAGCASVDGPAADDADAANTWPTEELAPIVGGSYVIEPGQEVVGELQVMRARYEDTFVDIARAYGLGYDELVAANPGIDPWLPGTDTPVILPTRFVLPQAPREGLVLNIAAKRLFYYPPAQPDEPQLVETYPIGIGREGWATPTGVTTVVNKARDPVWFVPASVRKEHREAGDPLPPQVPERVFAPMVLALVEPNSSPKRPIKLVRLLHEVVGVRVGVKVRVGV